jgi:hypothetical protein
MGRLASEIEGNAQTMHQSISLITTIAAAFGLALVLGFVAARLKMPALVGYLAAGIMIGPGTPGFVADVDIAGQLAEIGVMLLMFGIGLHFSLQELLSVRKIALPGAIVQVPIATALGVGVATWWGWPLAGAIVFDIRFLMVPGESSSASQRSTSFSTCLGFRLWAFMCRNPISCSWSAMRSRMCSRSACVP